MTVIRITGLAIMFLSIFSSVVFADGGTKYEIQEVDGYTVGINFSVGVVQLGHNEMNIQIKDKQGQPVGNAQVVVTGELYKEDSNAPAGGMNMNMGHGSAAPVTEKKPTLVMRTDMVPGKQPGEYQGELSLDEAGHWMIQVTSIINGQEKSVEFAEEVSKKGPNVAVLSGFSVAVVGIISAAAVTRKKPGREALTGARQ